MKVTLRLHSILKDKFNKVNIKKSYYLQKGAKVEELLNIIGLENKDSIFILVNNTFAPPDKTLHNGDIVTLVSILVGG